MKPLTSVENIKDPYMKRILSNTIGKDAFKLFSATPARLSRAVKGLPGRKFFISPAKGKWSIAQILAHLCDGEIVLSWRIRLVIAQSGTVIQAFDENKWAKEFRYDTVDWKKALELFLCLRKSNIDLLKSLKVNQWKHFGIHEERGKETIERMVQMFAGHDVNHLKQIENIAKSLK